MLRRSAFRYSVLLLVVAGLAGMTYHTLHHADTPSARMAWQHAQMSFHPAGTAQDLKQESPSLPLGDRPTKLYLDYRVAPALLQIQIGQARGQADIHYGDLRVQVWDQNGREIPVRAEQPDTDLVPGMQINSLGGFLNADYHFAAEKGQHAAVIEIRWQGETQRFAVVASHHLLGYSLDK